MKCGKSIAKAIMWVGTTTGMAAILIYVATRYDWKAAALAFIACAFGVILKTLYTDEWEEDDEYQN